MIVMKFGGSSVESATAIQQVAGIVKDHLKRNPVVVVSAMGKTTDRLLEAAQAAACGDSYTSMQLVENLRRTHFSAVRELLGLRAEGFLRESIAPLFREIQVALIEIIEGQEFTPQVQDHLLSYGERLSSMIVAEAFKSAGLPAAQVDARKVIVTGPQHTHATPLYWDTYERLRRTVALVGRDRVVVMGGFIGATINGVTTTLGRGGSDLTASLVAAGISAEEIQIWTDVDGLLSCDPRVLAGGYRLREVSFEEAEEMARFGAKVLCPSSVAPACRQSIPIVIRNSRQPEVAGTRVVSNGHHPQGIVKSVTSKSNMVVVRLRARNQGTLSSITDGLADLFARERISIDLIQVREQSIWFAVQNWPGLPKVLRRIDESVEVTVEEGRAGIWLVGQGIAQVEGLPERAHAALSHIDVRLTQRGSASSIGFIVPESDLRAATEALHATFFDWPDPLTFAAQFSASEPSARHRPESDVLRPAIYGPSVLKPA